MNQVPQPQTLASVSQRQTLARVPQRQAYGEALADYGALNPRVVVLDADVSSSDYTSFFAKKHPERFFNFGVTEASMVDVGVGMALGGAIPFVNTFASLLSLRAFESIRTCVAYAHANVKLVGGFAGISDYKDGPTHFAINDISLIRSLPGMMVLSPADNIEAARLVPLIAEYDGPVYMRISRSAVADVFTAAHQPVIGQGTLVRPGRDVTIIATGCMVGRSLEAVKILAQSGIDARLVSMHSIKPLDKAMVITCASETGALVTAEDHTVLGGLGSAVAETLAGSLPVPQEMVGIADTFGGTGPDTETLMDAWGLSVADVVAAVQRVLTRKKK